MKGLALGAAGVAAERLLAALVAGHARHPVVHAIARRIIAILEQLPASAICI